MTMSGDSDIPPNPFLPDDASAWAGSVTDNFISTIHVGSFLMTLPRHNLTLVRKMTWEAATCCELAVADMGANPRQAHRAVAFEAAVAVDQWCRMYSMEYQDRDEPPTSAIDGFLCHSMQGRPMEAVHVLDWADQLAGVDEYKLNVHTAAAAAGDATTDLELVTEIQPKRGAMVTALCSIMGITRGKAGDPDTHRGHGCPLDPERPENGGSRS